MAAAFVSSRKPCSSLFVFVLAVSFALSAFCARPGHGSESHICIIADSGLVVSEHNPHEQRAPASMVKMALMLLVAEGVEDGTWKLDKTLTVPKAAEKPSGAGVGLRAGQEYTLEQLIKAVAIVSANDAAAAVAVALWGTEEAYLRKANLLAYELGMKNTRFRSPHGLPPAGDAKGDVSTARDLAVLARACSQNPLVMSWVGEESFVLSEDGGVRRSTNRLLGRMPGCDGLKTGFTLAAGYCIAATAKRDGVRLITVVMGCRALQDRFEVAERVLEDGFSRVSRVRVLAKGQRVEAAVTVHNSDTPFVQLASGADVWFALREGDAERVRYVPRCPDRVNAPLSRGTEIGQVDILLAGQVLASAPLMIPEDLEVPSWQWKMRHSVVRRRQMPNY